MRHPPYPKYKASGVEWLGDVPEHWSTPPLYTRYTVELGKMLNEGRITGEHLIPYLRNVDVQWDRINFEELPEMDIAPSERERYTIAPGDLLVCEGGEIGRAAMVSALSQPIGFQKALHRMRPGSSREVPRFMYYTLCFASESGIFISEGNPNTISHLTGEKLRRYRFPAPPPAEQRTIAGHLDSQTAKLDTLVAKKQALIQKLKEKRTALISRTVTRGLPPDAARAAGLDPHPTLKPSGVDWLGDIPKHWNVIMLKRTWASCEYGISESLSGEGPIRVLTMGDVQDGLVLIPDEGCVEEVPSTLLLKDGDLVFNRTNSLAHVGKVGIYRGRVENSVTFASYLVRLRFNTLATSVFMNLLLNTPGLLEFARALALPSINQANLNPTRYGQIQVALPPIAEQCAIVEYLNNETTTIAQMITKVDVAVDRLVEYRTALITASVTGKIDLREAVTGSVAPTLPESGDPLTACSA